MTAPTSTQQRSAFAARSAVARYAIVLTGLLAVLLAVRILALKLNGTDLFFDEAQYWSWSLEPAFGYYSKPPLIAWVIGLSTSACGVSEFCIRLPSPLIHAATSGLVFAIGVRLYDAQVGFWSALVFATLPGVSFSAGIISTDVPLLFCWALALLGYIALTQSRSWWPALVLGAALGIGLNAKYAMAYVVLCIAVDLVATPERRRLLADPRLWLSLVTGIALIIPNLFWNASHSFATFSHTADNAKWTGNLVNPLKALEFAGTQFGVFGPILFGGLLVIAMRAYRNGIPAADRLLLAFALPVLVVVTVQAFLSRAHANWAAVSYVAAAVLVTATMIRDLSWGWLRASLGLHVAIVASLGVATAMAGTIVLPGGAGDPFARTLGWRNVADATAVILADARKAGRPFGSVIADERALSAELLYYMRAEPTPLLAWRTSAKPADHYELTRPFTSSSRGPVLLVAMRNDASGITKHFAEARKIAQKALAAGKSSSRTITYFELDGYRGR